ncbi:hypothetical protein L484_027047 [Morus notabilis]|uniref:Uncharacterized protein n=1 Tax=Morus notabilis TaxID=981085 RepID=W9S0V8_9ROSA|nr:hypothetical protein L484_027047 [Morus notabilis]
MSPHLLPMISSQFLSKLPKKGRDQIKILTLILVQYMTYDESGDEEDNEEFDRGPDFNEDDGEEDA